MDTCEGLRIQIHASVELLLLETEEKLAVLALVGFEHWGEKDKTKQPSKQMNKHTTKKKEAREEKSLI